MGEVLLSSLSSLLKGGNFAGKRLYISKMNGLEQLSRWLCGEAEIVQSAKPPQRRKIRQKAAQLLEDFVRDDDSIINDGCYVRDTLGADEKLLDTLFGALLSDDLKSA